MSILNLAAFLAPSALVLFTQAQTRPPAAEEILARLEAVTGDPAARAKAKNLVVRGTFSSPMIPGEGRFEQVYAADGRVKWRLECMGMPMTQGTTCEFTWSSCPGRGVTIYEGEAQALLLRWYGTSRRASWKSLYRRAELVQETELSGRKAFELRMIPEAGAADTWFVDVESSTLARVDTRAPDAMAGEVTLQYELSDWKRVDGVLYPFMTRGTMGALTIINKTTTLEHVEELDPASIAPDEPVLAAWNDPARRMPAPEKAGEFTLVRVAPQPTATVRVKVPETEISQTLASILPEVMGHLTSIGADLSGPPFARYHERAGGLVDIEAGMPVKKPITGKGRVRPGELPGGEIAVTWHFGRYEDLPSSYALLEGWMKSKRLAARAPFWEVYWTDPGLDPDPAKWKTQILWPVTPAP